MDRVTAGLLVRALRGWLGGPEAAAAPVAVRKWSRSQSQGWLRVEGTREDGGEADGGEMVDWVDTRGRVICALSRNVVHAMNVLHRGAGVMIRNEKVTTIPRGQVCILYALHEPQEHAQGGKYSCGGTEENTFSISSGAGGKTSIYSVQQVMLYYYCCYAAALWVRYVVVSKMERSFCIRCFVVYGTVYPPYNEAISSQSCNPISRGVGRDLLPPSDVDKAYLPLNVRHVHRRSLGNDGASADHGASRARGRARAGAYAGRERRCERG